MYSHIPDVAPLLLPPLRPPFPFPVPTPNPLFLGPSPLPVLSPAQGAIVPVLLNSLCWTLFIYFLARLVKEVQQAGLLLNP